MTNLRTEPSTHGRTSEPSGEIQPGTRSVASAQHGAVQHGAVQHGNTSRPTDHTTTPADGSSFRELGLSGTLVAALVREGYAQPTPIQGQSIPHLLDGRDLLGCAQTGTGKTAAFLLPILHALEAKPAAPHAGGRERRAGGSKPRALILAPTRELAAQIGERASAYGGKTRIRHSVVFGGVAQGPQERRLAENPEVLIATPGRLLDLLQQGIIDLSGIEYFVLDEADRMLDMGFIHDVKRVIAKLPRKRQTVLFSATMPPSVLELANGLLSDPVHVAVKPAATTAETVSQSVRFVARANKRTELESILRERAHTRTLVFTRTKHGANRIAEQLSRSGFIAAAIHGNKSQGARERALEGFRAGSVSVLVATDIAARGIDVDGIGLVINFDLPNVPESYVHRIGRTGRAEATGAAISLCDPTEERDLLRAIERFIRVSIPSDSSTTEMGRDSAAASTGRSELPRERTETRQNHGHFGRRNNGALDSRGPRRPDRGMRGSRDASDGRS